MLEIPPCELEQLGIALAAPATMTTIAAMMVPMAFAWRLLDLLEFLRDTGHPFGFGWTTILTERIGAPSRGCRSFAKRLPSAGRFDQ